MAPARPRNDEARSESANGNGNIQTKEKDVLHKTLNPTISKPKAKGGTTMSGKNGGVLTVASEDRVNTANKENGGEDKYTSRVGSPNSIWLASTNLSQIDWYSMSSEELNKYRVHHRLPLSACFSNEQSRVSLENPDMLGIQAPTMSGLINKRPVSHVQLAEACKNHFDSMAMNETEAIARFQARILQDRQFPTLNKIKKNRPTDSRSESLGR
jgi:hypothetical protein